MHNLSGEVLFDGGAVRAGEGVRVVNVGCAVGGGSLRRGIKVRSFVSDCLVFWATGRITGGLEVVIIFGDFRGQRIGRMVWRDWGWGLNLHNRCVGSVVCYRSKVGGVDLLRRSKAVRGCALIM